MIPLQLRPLMLQVWCTGQCCPPYSAFHYTTAISLTTMKPSVWKLPLSIQGHKVHSNSQVSYVKASIFQQVKDLFIKLINSSLKWDFKVLANLSLFFASMSLAIQIYLLNHDPVSPTGDAVLWQSFDQLKLNHRQASKVGPEGNWSSTAVGKKIRPSTFNLQPQLDLFSSPLEKGPPLHCAGRINFFLSSQTPKH